jgi:hypothetical protein
MLGYRENAEIMQRKRLQQIYIDINNVLDTIDVRIAKAISEGRNICVLFHKKNPKIDYHKFFTEYCDGENIPIYNRMRKLCPKPDFKCKCGIKKYGIPAELHYIVEIKWRNKDDNCVIL